jgi:hypothetical protein
MKFNIEVDLPKRTIDSITQYCENNNLILSEYISDCITKQNNIDRYGDLNDIIKKDKVLKDDSVSIETDNKNITEIKEVAATAKKDNVEQKTIININTETDKPKNKTRRTLKSK